MFTLQYIHVYTAVHLMFTLQYFMFTLQYITCLHCSTIHAYNAVNYIFTLQYITSLHCSLLHLYTTVHYIFTLQYIYMFIMQYITCLHWCGTLHVYTAVHQMFTLQYVYTALQWNQLNCRIWRQNFTNFLLFYLFFYLEKKQIVGKSAHKENGSVYNCGVSCSWEYIKS